MIRAVATKYFIPNKTGSIVNVIAVIRNGFPGMPHTGAARAAVENLTKSLATEWGRYNIRVNCIAPGTILSEALQERYPRQLLELALEKIPLNRYGKPDEVACELPTAFVVLKPNKHVTAAELVEWTNNRTSVYKHLRGGVIFIDQVPKSPSGKILRRLLRNRFIPAKL